MPLFGNIVVIKRNGTDGISFPLTASSCLFGRRTECDIRIQLPQVSKEHCKIEVNENKEAILTNLSSVNPTQLNGGCFQQPVPLKHGDVVTIIDRSFRFEYPLQSTPRKKRSRSPKDETLQVLHVQQVAEVEPLRQQTPGSKSFHASDTAECEEKNATEKKQYTEEKISKALPIQQETPKTSRRVQQSIKKQYEMSPFSKLYEKLKHEVKMDIPLQERNRSQHAAKEGSKSVLLEPSAQISSSSGVYDLGCLPKKKVGRSENKEVCIIEQCVISSEFNEISGGGSAARKSFTTSLLRSVSKKMSRDTGERSHLQDHKELSTANKSTGMEVTTTPSKGNDGNAAFPYQLCSIQCMDFIDNTKAYSCPVAVNKPAQTMSVPEVDKYILSTPTSRRKSSQSRFLSPTREASGMNPVTADTPKTGCRVSLKRGSLTEIPAGTLREDWICRNNPEQLPVAENKCLKQRRNSKQRTPGTPGKVLKEISDQASFVNSQEGCSQSPASLLSSKSPRRNNRQSKELSNKSVPSEMLASEELASELAPAAQKADSGRKRGRRRTSGSLTDKALETNASEEHKDKTTDRKDSGTKEELAMKEDGQKQDLEDASVVEPHRLSSKRRSSGSATVLKDTEAVSETNVCGLLAGEESGKTKRNPQKRSGDVLLQPLGKRKRVSFGGHLSPELFDKSLPPNSPLKKGAIPARLSLPFGDSPRAVLKKAQGLKHFAVQELSEHSQKEKVSPKTVPSRKSPAASPPATPTCTAGSPAPYTKGRFSVSCVTTPLPIVEEKDPLEEDMNMKEKKDAQVQTPTSFHVNQDDKTFLTPTPTKSRRSAKFPPKATPGKRRSGSVAVLSAQRKSGASSANLLVAKSWAEVVKLGAARPQSKTVKKRVQKGTSVKKRTQSPKTPVRKIKGHFSTGHAESPATIVVGRAYSTTVRTSGRVPKVVKNTMVKLNVDMDESFTGMPEMFQTPENKSGKQLPLATGQKTDFTPPTCSILEVSDLQTPEESGEMMVSPLNNSDASEQKEDNPGICHFLREEESLKSVFAAIATETPEKQKATLEESLTVDSLSTIPEQQASQTKSRSKRRTPKKKLEPDEVVSGIKQLLRTPKQRSEPVEALSGVKELMKTPKQRLEPVEVLSGIKQLMRTPKQKPEPAEVLSGIKQLMRTPKQKPEPAEVLSGIKQLMRTPKQKPEPAEVLSGIKQLMRTPKQKPEPAEVLSGIKQLMRTPKQKPEPVEVLSGIKQLMRTPKQKPEPAEVLSGIKQLMRTPKQKPEPAEVLSGIKQLMRTPKQKPEPAEVLSGIKQLMRTPQQELEPVLDEIAFKRLLKTPVQETEAVKDVAGVAVIKKTPKMKHQPVEDMIGVGRIFKTPKEKVEPIEDMLGISRLVKTPRQKYQPADDFVGLQKLLAEHKEKRPDVEVDYIGVKEMFDVPEEMKVTSVNAMDSQQEDTAPPCSNSSHKYEDKGNISHGKDPQQKESTVEDQPTQRPTRGRSRRTVHPASAKQCEMNLDLKELQGMEKKSTQEEIREISTSVLKNKGKGRRINCGIEEILSNQEKVETVSFVEPHGAAQRPGRGKRKEPKGVKHPSENLQACGKDSSVQQKDPVNTERALQPCDINNALETEGDATVKTVVGSSGIQNENCQLQTGVKSPETKSNEGGVEDSKEKFLSPWKRSRGAQEVESTEPVIPPKRGRRARNVQVQQAAVEDPHETTRRLRRDPSAKMVQGHGQKNAAISEEFGSGAKPEEKITEGRAKSLRSARKHSPEVKADICVIVLENIQSTRKTEEKSAKASTGTQPRLKSEIKVSLGDKNSQENTTETSQRLKAESPSGETNKMPVAALSLEVMNNAVQEPRRTRNRRGKKDSLEKQPAEFTKDANNLELITPKVKPEKEMVESSLSSVSVMKDQNNPDGTSIPAEDSDSLPHSCPKRTRNEQGILKAKPTAGLQVNLAQNNTSACRRGRGRKVNFELEETSSKVVGGENILPGDEKDETSENPTLQVRRRRRKQSDSIPQTGCSSFVEKQTLIAEHCKDKASEKEQNAAMEATPSSTEDNPWRQGKSEVAAAPRTSRSLSARRRCGLLEGDDKKTTEREDPALGSKTLQAKANVSARGRRKKIDVAVEAKSSSLQRKRGLSETDDKEESTNEEQNMPLETVSCAEEKPLGRGRRKETAPASHTTNYSSLRGKRGLPANNGREGASEEDRSVPNQLRKSRRKGIALFSEALSPTSTQGKQGLSKESGRKNDGEARKPALENSTSQEKMGLSKRSLRQTISSLAVSSTSLQGLPEDGKNETPEQQEKILVEIVPSAKENPSRVGRKKITSKSEETSSASLREKPALAKDRGQKKILKVSEDASLENKSSQEKTKQLRSKGKKVEFALEAERSSCNNSDLPGHGNALETQTGCLASTGSEKNNPSGQEGANPVPQPLSTARRRKCQLPADDLASKKLKSENDENKLLEKGKRNKSKEERDKEAARATQTAGGTDRKTRSNTRTSARTRK
ncbi:proliferation marker protein Ki-67 [Porphyrio hochstetteri]